MCVWLRERDERNAKAKAEKEERGKNCVIDVDGKLSGAFVKQLEGLIELLFSVINRPNHSVDRQTRAVGCECLRKLERACPCLLSQVAGNLWSLCQSERTHAAQSYVLLLAQGESCEPETGKESKEKDTSVALKSQAMAEQMEELRSKTLTGLEFKLEAETGWKLKNQNLAILEIQTYDGRSSHIPS
ncbi:hypothetical protein AgCh_029370 [Apium graveolens]